MKAFHLLACLLLLVAVAGTPFGASVYAQTIIHEPGANGKDGEDGGLGDNGQKGGDGEDGKLTYTSNVDFEDEWHYRQVGGHGGRGGVGSDGTLVWSSGSGGAGGHGGTGRVTINTRATFNSSYNTIVAGGNGGRGGDGGDGLVLHTGEVGGRGGDGGQGTLSIRGRAIFQGTDTPYEIYLGGAGGDGGDGGRGGFSSISIGGTGGLGGAGGEGVLKIEYDRGSETQFLDSFIRIGGPGGTGGEGGYGTWVAIDGNTGGAGGRGTVTIADELTLFDGTQMFVGGNGGHGGQGGVAGVGEAGSGGVGGVGGAGYITVDNTGLFTSGNSSTQVGGNGGDGGEASFGTLSAGGAGNGGTGGLGQLVVYGGIDSHSLQLGGNGGKGGIDGGSFLLKDGGTGDGGVGGAGFLSISSPNVSYFRDTLQIGGSGGESGSGGHGTDDDTQIAKSGQGGQGVFRVDSTTIIHGTLHVGGRGGEGKEGDTENFVGENGGQGGVGGVGEFFVNAPTTFHETVHVGGDGGHGGDGGEGIAYQIPGLDGLTPTSSGGFGGNGGHGGSGTLTILADFSASKDVFVGGKGGNSAHGGMGHNGTIPLSSPNGEPGRGGAGTLEIVLGNTTIEGLLQVGGDTGKPLANSPKAGPDTTYGGEGLLRINGGVVELRQVQLGGNASQEGSGGGDNGGDGFLEINGGKTTFSGTFVAGGAPNEDWSDPNSTTAEHFYGKAGHGTMTIAGGTTEFLSTVQLGGDAAPFDSKDKDDKADIKRTAGTGTLLMTGGMLTFHDHVALGGWNDRGSNGDGTGTATISGGRLMLDTDAHLTLRGNSIFTMTGGTLATSSISGGHIVKAGTISITNVPKLEFDLLGANASTVNLVFDGYLTAPIGKNDIIVTGVPPAPTAPFTYTLVDTQSANRVTPTGMLYINDSIHFYVPKRSDGFFYGLSTNNTASMLQLIAVENPGGNTKLTWNTGSGVWDDITENWMGVLHGIPIASYWEGDDVYFEAPHVAFNVAQVGGIVDPTIVTIDGTTQGLGVNPNSMFVQYHADWMFTGNPLNITENLTIQQYAAATFDVDTRAAKLYVHHAAFNTYSGNVFVDSATFDEYSRLGIAITNPTQAAITVADGANWHVHETAVLDITGYDAAAAVIGASLVKATSGNITEFFATENITVAGNKIGSFISEEFFLNGVEISQAVPGEITAHLGGLIWYNGVAPGTEGYDAHGTFNVHTMFHVRTALNDNVSGNGAAFNWDGTTLTKRGAGILYLDAANTYTGRTIIEEGVVVATDRDALGTGDVRLDRETGLVLDWNVPGMFANVIDGEGQFIVRSGSVTIDQSNDDFSGNTLVANLAELTLDHADAVGTSVLHVAGIVNINADVDNNFRGDGRVVLDYDGLHVDYANEGFTGTIEVKASATLGHVRGFGDTSLVDIADSKTLTLDFSGHFAAPVKGGATSEINVAQNRLVRIDADNSDYDGQFAIENGAIVTINHIDALGDSTNSAVVQNDGILHFNIDGVDPLSFEKSINGSGGIIKSGSNELTLGGSLSYTGATFVRGGTLIADLMNGNGLFLLNDGSTFQMSSKDGQLDRLNGIGNVTFDGNGYSLSVQTGDFSDGTMTNLDTLTVTDHFSVGNVMADSLSVGSNASLFLATGKQIVLEGGASFGSDSTFGVTISDLNRPVVRIGDTSAWDVAPTATLDIQGYRFQEAVLIETTGADFNEATDMFQNITVAGGTLPIGGITIDQFINLLTVTINDDNKRQIVARFGDLVWYNGVTPGTEHDDAHGTFAINTFFRLEEQLANNDSGQGAAFGWDGTVLTKKGDGILVLGAANTYTGGTVIEAGTIVMQNDSAVGSGKVSLASDLVVNYAGVFANEFQGNGTLSSRNNLVIESNNPDFNGSVNILGGTLVATRPFSLGNNITTTMDEDTALVYHVSANGTVANAIKGEGAFVKSGTGTLAITGMQTYAGPTQVLAGTLQMNLPTNTALFVDDNAVYQNIGTTPIVLSRLDGTGRLDATNANLTIGGGDFGKLENVKDFTKDTAETLTLDGSLNVGGDFDLADGTLVLTGMPSLIVFGQATFGRGTTLSFSVAGLDDDAIVVTAARAVIGRDTTLDITGYNGETELTLLKTTGGPIAGDFSDYRVNGVSMDSSRVTFETFFVPGGIRKSPTEIVMEQAHLVWNNEEDFSAHGTFFIDTESVTINRSLADNPHDNAYMYNPSYGKWWDGKSLTKTGEGTLVLNGSNEFTGDVHVRAGTLVGTHVHSFGDPDSTGKFILDPWATLQFEDFDVHITKPVEGFGRFLKTGNSTLVFEGDASEAYGIFHQQGGTVDLRSNWGGYYLMEGGLLTTNDDRRIEEGALFTDGIVHHKGTLTVGKRLITDNVHLVVLLGANEQRGGAFNNNIAAGEIYLRDTDLDFDVSEFSLPYFRSVGNMSWTILESDNGIHGDFRNVDKLIVNNRLFHASYGIRDDNDNYYWVLELDAVDDPFFGFNDNTWQVADYLNRALDEDPALTALLLHIGSLTDDDEYRNAIDGLRGSEIHAQARKLALWQPWRNVYKRLYADNIRSQRTGMLGQSAASPRDVWFEGHYGSSDVRSDGNAVGYAGHRGGIMTGMDTRWSGCSKLGFVFGYGNPRLSNRLGRVKADDYTFGLSSRARLTGNVHALAFFGYGHQNYKTTRTDLFDRHNASYSGDSLYGSVQLYQPVRWQKNVMLYPLIALDYQGTWTGKVMESGLYGQTISKGSGEELVLRFGLDARFRRNNRMDVTTRLQYGVLVGGDRYATAVSHFTASSSGSTMDLRGVNAGRSGLNIGIGGNGYVDSRQRTRLFADYDFELGERLTAHTGQAGIVTNW